ncbi:HupE/UreJ family protein [Sinomicrobium pectinilyticum]|uniref:HupE/UreJ family protein n=1 Tax=Sinomicrobium pectinilyticum TaxID=1084421 RepID=A0A3N0E899_SINP1|nr:HupE/UreJ family protein [Sinomicrobium pectinilyticum]RNL84074.1 HupE/UreJ family protein [Sinomicrobium pectinilyticum]
MSQFWLYFKLGLTHVLDINAYDHILFLVALTVPYTFNHWKKILWLVTVFTIGHTLSLIMSTYGLIRVSAALVEFLIPVTIFITALFNIFTVKRSGIEKFGPAFFVTLFFGIIHGLGFSSYFKGIIAGEENKLLPLLEFALGIEAAQVIVVLVVLIAGFILSTVFRFNRRDWILVISAMVIGVVLPMLIENYPY